MRETGVNRCFKDRLFVKLFGSAERAQDALELYNAVNETDYKNPEELIFYSFR